MNTNAGLVQLLRPSKVQEVLLKDPDSKDLRKVRQVTLDERYKKGLIYISQVHSLEHLCKLAEYFRGLKVCKLPPQSGACRLQ
jgi:hypothetical protein